MTTTTNGYENSPACRMLATHCACCGRPLVDADSVEFGIGPVCRERYGFNEVQADPNWAEVTAVLLQIGDAELESNVLKNVTDVRAAANILTAFAARYQGQPMAIFASRAIAKLGYRKLAAKIAAHAGAIETWFDSHPALGETVAVSAPFNPCFAGALKGQGIARVFDRDGQSASGQKKVWHVKAADRKALWRALSECFAGFECAGPNGITVIPRAA